MRVRFALYGAVMSLALAGIASAQDPVKVDPQHYSVVSENDEVRILKVHYGPHEKSVMHSHPNSVATYLSDGRGQFTLPDGKTQAFETKANEAQYTPATTHLPENTGDTPVDLILVELKAPAAKKKSGK